MTSAYISLNRDEADKWWTSALVKVDAIEAVEPRRLTESGCYVYLSNGQTLKAAASAEQIIDRMHAAIAEIES